MLTKKLRTILVLCLAVAVLFAACAAEPVIPAEPEEPPQSEPVVEPQQEPEEPQQEPVEEVKVPKYVFYLIGDGLGASQRQISEYYYQHQIGDDNAKLAMNKLPVAGMNTTFAEDTLVTDSAAAGTSLACGIKTNSKVIAQTSDGKDATSLIEAVQEIGYATGIVTTTRVTHATPAVFVAHNPNRDDENGIAMDMLDCGVDFIGGGGYRNFIPASVDGSKRKDEEDLLKGFSDSGYNVFYGDTASGDLASYEPAAGDKVVALLTSSHMPQEIDRANTKPDLMSLSDLTESAVKLLETDEEGFFLMVEAGRIDHACHPNDLVGTVYDTLEFDEVVQVALNFYDQHPDETLIVVVGDHETGGMGLGLANDYFLTLEGMDGITASFNDGYGYRNAYEANGDREAFFEYLTSIGLKDLTEEERAKIEAGMDMVDAGIVSDANSYGNNEASLAVNVVISERVGVQWTSYAHTGTQIPFGVQGVCQEEFGGFMDNTEVANTIAEVLGIDIGV